ncbi:hypothetical protein SteCoe_18160 [Stentor coeruleus]|uniref:XRN2-binding (XTBD) domain-containing protein n=1 Tax=Stentor coeruleus TaxID=5963 RepID=A0A1R2BX51_9CILI|nr:hypothetical protein SteCoe_18160 [Stentor coeruleus]
MEKLPHETRQMFEKRKSVYEKAMDLGNDSKDSIKYANIWANVTYLRCKYSHDLTEKAFQIARQIENLDR